MDRLEFFPRGLFISGTDTDVGKTMITTGLVRFLNAYGIETYGVKPVCCGGTEDLKAIQSVNPSPLSNSELNPLYLPAPAAPLSITTETPSLKEILKPLKELNKQFLIAEGAGGWKVPVNKEWDMESLAIELEFPAILVIANRLGCINHALLTAQAIQQAGIPLLGFFINTVEESNYIHAQSTNRQIIEELLPCPCLGEIPLGGATISSSSFSNALKIPPNPDLPLQFYPSYS